MLRSLSQRAGTTIRAAQATHSSRNFGVMAAAASSHSGATVRSCKTPARFTVCLSFKPSLTICMAAGEKGLTKIKVKNSIIDLDGDEMTRY